MKKIMFNDKYGLTKAVIEGRKTQTRRIVPESTLRKAKLVVKICGGSMEERIEEQARYLFREEIAVVQSYKDAGIDPFHLISPVGEGRNAMDVPGWDNKMFVKAELMPHRIKITNV